MTQTPSPNSAGQRDLTRITVCLSADLASRLGRIIDTCVATHPQSEPDRITDLVMAAGIEAVERDAPLSTAVCSSETRATRPATKPIAGPVGMNNPGSP